MIGSTGIKWKQLLKISHYVNKTCSSLKWKVKMYMYRTLSEMIARQLHLQTDSDNELKR